MQIDPKLAMYLNIASLILSVFAVAGWWDDFLGDKLAATVTGIMLTFVSALNVVLHAYASPQPGPATSIAAPAPAPASK